MDQYHLAPICSINIEEVSRIENARRDYMYSTLLEVCEALGKTLFEISEPNEEADTFHLEYMKKVDSKKILSINHSHCNDYCPGAHLRYSASIVIQLSQNRRLMLAIIQ